MAYRNLLNQSCASRSDLFRHMRDFLCSRNEIADYTLTGLGWTLIDSSYASDETSLTAGDWIVVYSPGENGREDMYCKITYYSTTYFTFMGYLYWNATTHAGVTGYGILTVGTYTSGSTFSLNMYGDLNNFTMLADDQTNNWVGIGVFGMCDDCFEGTDVVISASLATAGTGKVLTFDSVPTSWEVGQKIFIRDNAHIELTTITALSGLTVTVDLANSYAANFRAQAHNTYMCLADADWNSSAKLYRLITTTGVLSAGYVYPNSIPTAQMGSYNPGTLNAKRLLDYLNYTFSTVGGGWITTHFFASTTGLSDRDTFRLPDGSVARYFLVKNSGSIIIKEV